MSLSPVFFNCHDRPIRIAGSAKYYEEISKPDFLADNGLSIEYTPSMHELHGLQSSLRPYLERGVAIRHHAFFPGLELADEDDEKSTQSVALHNQMLDLIAGYGEQIITVHIGVDTTVKLNPAKAVDNLSSLAERARKLGITLSLENLRRGLTSDPHIVLDWATQAGTSITLDLGHALCSEFSMNGGPDIYEVIRLFESRLAEVHFYERETDRHYPPEDMVLLGPIVDALVQTPCDWWTIELESTTEIQQTCGLLVDHGTGIGKM